MNLIFKKTEEKDFFKTENLTREAFWNLYNPGCNEHFVLHNLRKSKSYIPELDIVAIANGEIVGHVITTKAMVIDGKNNEHEVLCAGPFSVLPELQNNGIGTKLFEYMISEARNIGYNAIILFGDPDYYHHFGFRNAKEFGIATKDNQNFEPFIALELQDSGLANIKGRFFEDSAFEPKEEELNEFEKLFPPKEKGKAKIDISQYGNIL